MRTVFAAIVGLATGVLVAGAPAANGLVLALGVLIGAVLYAAFQPTHQHERAPRLAAEDARRDDLKIVR